VYSTGEQKARLAAVWRVSGGRQWSQERVVLNLSNSRRLGTPAARSPGCANAANASPMTSIASAGARLIGKQSQDWCRFHTDPRSGPIVMMKTGDMDGFVQAFPPTHFPEIVEMKHPPPVASASAPDAAPVPVGAAYPATKLLKWCTLIHIPEGLP
jgi:hypothetical protein